MIELKKKKKLQEKRRFIIKRLIELGKLPQAGQEKNEEQQKIYDDIWAFDFSYWENVKEENGWTPHAKLSGDQIVLREKRHRVRTYLRDNGVLPNYGEPLNEEQQKIVDDIENNNFTFFESYKNEKMERLKMEQRNNGVTNRVEKIVSSNKNINRNSDLPGYTATSLPKAVFFRLRMCQILPPIGQPFNEIQQMIVDDVYENWLGKPKSHFVIKYIEHSTPEGRLLYRMHKSHLDYGFNFNLTIEDIVIPEKCPILEIPLSTDPKDYKEQNYYTADRIDSSKGLVKGNIQVISMLANRMKNKATESELLTFATNGLKILNNVE